MRRSAFSMKTGLRVAFGVVIVLMLSMRAFSQTASQGGVSESSGKGPRVFLDCSVCDFQRVQEEIPFVTWVKDCPEAQVCVCVTSRETPGKGIQYTLRFTGQEKFQGDDETLTVAAEKEKSPEMVETELIHTLKMGLMRYVGKTPAADRISIRLEEEVKPTAVEDRWNFWVFSLSGNAFLNGEKLYKSGMYFASLSANRVTEAWKIRMSVSGMASTSEFTFGDEVIKSSRDSLMFNGLVVKSLGEHWSIGAFFSAFSSTFTNVRFSIAPAPAIEYNIFPYSESTRRELRILYTLGFNPVRYFEETIYQKTRETLWKQSLTATLELKQKWGTVSTAVEGSHYFHDFRKNRLEVRGELSFRLIRGFNFNIDASYSRIHDQLSLPRGGASLEEVLLRIKELETTYSYRVSVGISYTFGSIHSRVVNPRFGDGGRGISISF